MVSIVLDHHLAKTKSARSAKKCGVAVFVILGDISSSLGYLVTEVVLN